MMRVGFWKALWIVFISTSTVLGSVDRAHAAGIEDTVAGTIALGRAANYARVNDFMATWQNPANLAVVPDANVGVELRLPILRACFDRARAKGVSYKDEPFEPTFRGSEHFDNVCNDAAPGPAGNLGYAQSFAEKFGFGVGLFTPSAVGSSKYGDDTIVTLFPLEDETLQTTPEGVESPNRQMGLERRALAAFLMLGVGYQASDSLRVGLSAGAGYASIYNKTVVSVQGGTFQDQEVLSELDVSDAFVPRMTASVVYSPLHELDLFGTYTYQDDIIATGDLTLTANGIQGAPLKKCSEPKPGPYCRVGDVELTAPYHTSEIIFGLRYAKKRTGEKSRALVPMRDEQWDIEIDVSFAQTSQVDAFELEIHDKDPTDPDVPRIQFSSSPNASTSFVRKTIRIPKDWDDQWTLRAGGDYNVVPEVLALRAGLSYASHAVPPETMNIDYWPVQKVGIHLGATYAFSRYRASFAYAHLFYRPVDVLAGTGRVKEIATVDENLANAVNEGYYQAAQDVISVQVDATF